MKALKWYSLGRRTYTRKRAPQAWAEATAGLAEVHARLDRNKADLQQAIRLTRAALTVYTPKDYPKDNRFYRLTLERLRDLTDKSVG